MIATDSGAQKILKEALEKGYVECHIWKVLVTGAAGSGKTTLKYCPFKSPLAYGAVLPWQRLLFRLSQEKSLAQIKLAGSESHQMS